jgi:hypothetical protein
VGRRLGIPIALASAAVLVAAGVALVANADSGPETAATPKTSNPHSAVPHVVQQSSPSRCGTRAVQARAKAVTAVAKRRYDHEHFGVLVHDALRRVARDPVLLQDLSAGGLRAALAEGNRQLVLHTVRIRVVHGSRVVMDANPTSFAVGGAKGELYGPHHKALGRAEVTVQDIIGFIKLVHKYHPGDVVVRGQNGHAESSLRAAMKVRLPASGCTTIAGHQYLVRSFPRTGFAGEPLRIWVLV